MSWQSVQLGQVCMIQKQQFRDGNLPYVGMEDIEGHTGKFLGSMTPKAVASSTFEFSSEHLLYGRLRPYLNKVLIPDFKGHCSSEIFPLKPSNKLKREYLFYWLSSDNVVTKINKTCTGARMPRANVKEVLTFEIPLPPIPEQKRIVAILDQAFADLEQVRAKTEQNLKNARELFDSYLQQVFSELESECENRAMSDKTILTMIDGDRGKNYPTKADFQDVGHCVFLSTKNVRPNGFKFEEVVFISESKDKLLRKGRLERNDVIITTRGTIGNLAIYDDSVEFKNIRINSGMLILRPNTESITSSYLFEIMRSGLVKQQIKAKTSGAAQPQLPVNTLNSFSFPVPIDLKVQDEVVQKIRIMEVHIESLNNAYHNKLKCLDELKKSILQKAFSGELTAKAE